MVECVEPSLTNCKYFRAGECLCPDGCRMHPGLIIGMIEQSATVRGQGLILVKSWNSGRIEWLPRFAASTKFSIYTGFRL